MLRVSLNLSKTPRHPNTSSKSDDMGRRHRSDATGVLHSVTIMSTNNKNGGKSSSGGRKGSGQRNQAERGNTRKTNESTGKEAPRSVARLNIVASAQWALMFIQQMLNFPVKGARMLASTVDDIITQMTTMPVFAADPNLAIDTFRELKEKGHTDAYGRGFTFENFKEFISAHPALRRLRLRHDKELTDALFGKHSRPKVNRAADAAFTEGHEAYQHAFGSFLKENDLTVESFKAFSDKVKETFWKTFNPDYNPDANYALWLFDDTTSGIVSARKGDIVSKKQFRILFSAHYRLEGNEAPSRAYRLKGTAKVFPKMQMLVDNADSNRKTKGDPVSVEIDWVAVDMPSKGAGEFYLNRMMTFGDDVVNPAYGHLLNDGEVKKRWNNAGWMRLGWRPDPRLAHAYGPEVAAVLSDYEVSVDAAVATMTNGGSLHYVDGHWVIDEATVAEKPPKPAKKGKTFPAARARAHSNNDEDEAQPINVG